MERIETKLPGALLFRPTVHRDERGHFFESFRSDFFARELGVNFVQDNESLSQQHVLRGLHFQTGTHAQGKLIRVLQGQIFLAAVDLRADSPTRGQHQCFELDDQGKLQLWIPRGFANGYLVQSPSALVAYKCDNFYAPNFEGGLRWDDPRTAIRWPLQRPPILSEKDRNWPVAEKL